MTPSFLPTRRHRLCDHLGLGLGLGPRLDLGLDPATGHSGEGDTQPGLNQPPGSRPTHWGELGSTATDWGPMYWQQQGIGGKLGHSFI